MKFLVKGIALLLFGFSCGAAGQFGYYSEIMNNKGILLSLCLICMCVLSLIDDDSDLPWM